MLTIFFRTLITYFVLVFSVRLMGKRQIGELQVSEFIVALMLSEIAAAPITSRTMPLLYAIVPILLLLSVEVIVSYILLKSNTLKRLFYGSPTILIKRGKLLQPELSKNRIELDELMSELRQKGFSDPSDVYYAVLEENGKLSVFPTAGKSPATAEDLELDTTENGLAHVCVIDGKTIKKNLRNAGWDEARLFAELGRHGVELEDVFLMTVNDTGKVTLIKKEKKKK